MLIHCRVQAEYAVFKDYDEAFSVGAVTGYEEAITDAKSRGVNIRALMLVNPHNPLGRCYTKDALIEIMQLCERHKIHLLVDEIYAMSVYDVPGDDEAVPFTSVLSLDTDKYINSDYLHHLYGMSKDMACGGLRLGCIHTRKLTTHSLVIACWRIHCDVSNFQF